jgi:hypothetical protein
VCRGDGACQLIRGEEVILHFLLLVGRGNTLSTTTKEEQKKKYTEKIKWKLM